MKTLKGRRRRSSKNSSVQVDVAGHVWHICAGRAPQTQERMVLEKSSTGADDHRGFAVSDGITMVRDFKTRTETLREEKAQGRNAIHRRVGEFADCPGGIKPGSPHRNFLRHVLTCARRKRSGGKACERQAGHRTTETSSRLLGRSKPAKGFEPHERCWMQVKKHPTRPHCPQLVAERRVERRKPRRMISWRITNRQMRFWRGRSSRQPTDRIQEHAPTLVGC